MAISRSTLPASPKAHPVCKALRSEMNQQGISSYRMAKMVGSYPSTMTRMWNGEKVPAFGLVDKIVAVLRMRNPSFTISL